MSILPISLKNNFISSSETKNREDNLELKKQIKDGTKKITESKMKNLKTHIKSENPIINHIGTLLKNKNFKEIVLQDGDILFDEGDIDNNLYFILKGKISIEKYTTSEQNESKQLATLNPGDFLGEGSLKRTEAKEVKIVSINETKLLKINAKEGFKSFIKEEPEIGLAILVKIIDTSNIRLLDSNNKLTAILKMSEQISNIEKYDMKSIFSLIDSFSKIANVKYIIYLERNPIVKNYMSIKYDTRSPGKMQDYIVDLGDNILDIDDLKKEGIKITKYNNIQELKNGNKIVGYLVLGKDKKDFNDGENKNIISIANAIAGVVKQKEFLEAENNKDYSKNI